MLIRVFNGFKGVNPSRSDDIATFYLHSSELQTVTHFLFVVLVRNITTKNIFKRILKVLTSFLTQNNERYIIKPLDDSLLVLIAIKLSYSLLLILKT